jgi:hypothetical protein
VVGTDILEAMAVLVLKELLVAAAEAVVVLVE